VLLLLSPLLALLALLFSILVAIYRRDLGPEELSHIIGLVDDALLVPLDDLIELISLLGQSRGLQLLLTRDRVGISEVRDVLQVISLPFSLLYNLFELKVLLDWSNLENVLLLIVDHDRIVRGTLLGRRINGTLIGLIYVTFELLGLSGLASSRLSKEFLI
jgi:hypothetical protein